MDGTLTFEERILANPTHFLPTSSEILAKNTPGHTPRPEDAMWIIEEDLTCESGTPAKIGGTLHTSS